MADLLEFDGPPSNFIVRGGKPARCLGKDGWPSFETDSRVLAFDLLLANINLEGEAMFIPRRYGLAAVLTPEGQTSITRTSKRWWNPWLYRRTVRGWRRLGSQRELKWRIAMYWTLTAHTKDMVEKWRAAQVAEERAMALLREHLLPQQRLELAAKQAFLVRGGRTGNIYAVTLGDGFKLIEPGTTQVLGQFCYHPEYWMPDADVALTTMFQLEDPELEVQVLQKAKQALDWQTPLIMRPTRLDRYVADVEREMLTA